MKRLKRYPKGHVLAGSVKLSDADIAELKRLSTKLDSQRLLNLLTLRLHPKWKPGIDPYEIMP
jgi:hypothetical protein